MMQVNDDYYERLNEEKVGQILDELKSTGSSSMKSGPLCFLKWPSNIVKRKTVKTKYDHIHRQYLFLTSHVTRLIF